MWPLSSRGGGGGKGLSGRATKKTFNTFFAASLTKTYGWEIRPLLGVQTLLLPSYVCILIAPHTIEYGEELIDLDISKNYK